MKLVTALSKFVRIDGETTSQFVGELKKLTDKDKTELTEQLEKEGQVIEREQ